jgi:hypothetical protein
MLDAARAGTTPGLDCIAVGATSLLFIAVELVELGRALCGAGTVLRGRNVDVGRGNPLAVLAAIVADGAGILVPADDDCAGAPVFAAGREIVVEVDVRDGKPDDRAVSIEELLPVRDVGIRAVDVLG